jgi:capsular polysaccharide biosynthesis protein
MVEGVNSRPVAEGVIQELGLETTPEDLIQGVRVERIPDTQFIQVFYRDPSPDRAQQVANTMGSVFSEQIFEVSPTASAVTATVWEPAVTPNEPASPDLERNALLALALGLVLGIGLALLLEYLDDRWRSPEEAEQISGVPTFGVIPELEALTDKKRGGP